MNAVALAILVTDTTLLGILYGEVTIHLLCSMNRYSDGSMSTISFHGFFSVLHIISQALAVNSPEDES